MSSIFDKLNQLDFNNSAHKEPKTNKPTMSAKQIGQLRENQAINNIKKQIPNPDMLLQGIHLIHPVSNEICEIDGLFICNQSLHVVEIKSKNFTYLYGNTDTGHWYIEYNGKIVKSDNVYRQISRQMRILEAVLNGWEKQIPIYGHIFLNNKMEFNMDLIGPQPSHITLHTSIFSVCEQLCNYDNPDAQLKEMFVQLDRENKSKIPSEWVDKEWQKQ